jgi:hypothetical protein
MRPLSLHHPHSHTHSHHTLRRFHLLLALVSVLGASLLTLVNAPRVLACPVCIPPDKVTLSGDSIVGVATITDGQLLAPLSTDSFMGFEHGAPIARPVHTGTGVELTRYFKNSGVPDSFWTLGFDHMRYYPGAPGKPGYVFYEGFVSDEARAYAPGLDMPKSGEWYALTATGDEAIHQLLVAASASPKSSAAPLAPFTSPGQPEQPAVLRLLANITLPVAILLAFLALLVVGAGYRLIYLRHQRRAPFSPVQESAD